jgi:hypothetical protein
MDNFDMIAHLLRVLKVDPCDMAIDGSNDWRRDIKDNRKTLNSPELNYVFRVIY